LAIERAVEAAPPGHGADTPVAPGGEPVAYVALTGPAGAAPRVQTLDVTTGAVLDAASLDGQPRSAEYGGSLLVAPGPHGDGRRLFAVLVRPGAGAGARGSGARADERDDVVTHRPTEWARLVRFAAGSLDTDLTLDVQFAPEGLAVAPDGRDAYTFDAHTAALMRLDLDTGQVARVADVTGHVPGGLAADTRRVYAAVPRSDEVRVYDRRPRWPDRPVQVIRSRGYPILLLVAPLAG
jgi:hypothetical protein